MKKFPVCRKCCCCWIAGLMLLCFLSSCDTYYFTQPQPVDQQNLYEFPAIFRGDWTIRQDDGEVFIADKFARTIFSSKDKIVIGAWPKRNDSGQFIYPPSYDYFSHIKYDSLNNPVDTVAKYLLNNGRIYYIDSDGLLEKGYAYTLEKDTITLMRNDTSYFDLAHNVFLRRLNDSLYVLNINNRLLGENYDWWQLFVMQKTYRNTIKILEGSNSLDDLPSMIHSSRNYYFNSGWTAAAMTAMIKGGYFEKMSELRLRSEIPVKK